jgi:hypothetical protein
MCSLCCKDHVVKYPKLSSYFCKYLPLGNPTGNQRENTALLTWSLESSLLEFLEGSRGTEMNFEVQSMKAGGDYFYGLEFTTGAGTS